MVDVADEDKGTPIGGQTAGGCKVIMAEKKPPGKGGVWSVTVEHLGVQKTQKSPQRLKAEQLACIAAGGLA